MTDAAATASLDAEVSDGSVVTEVKTNDNTDAGGHDELESIRESDEGEKEASAPTDISAPDRNQGSSQSLIGGSIVGDVLYSIATGEEEGRSRHRILAFAAKRYQTAVERNPDDYDALYNWALVLQESADNCPADTGVTQKDRLLEDACRKYAGATEQCPTLHEAFYNWAIAISDRAKIRGRTLQAEELWKEACQKYERAVELNWDSPQALNNWGLALQELGGIVATREKVAIVKKAISKFRAAIRLRFDFHRAVYNLGTVLYGLAEDTLKGVQKVEGRDHPSDGLYSQSAVYIAAAHALKSDYPVYRNALRLVRTMLPLPYLKGGYLTVAPHGNSLFPHSEWKSVWVALDHEAIYQREKPEVKYSRNAAMKKGPTAVATRSTPEKAADEKAMLARRHIMSTNAEATPVPIALSDTHFRFDMSQVLAIEACGDMSLPEGAGMVLETTNGSFYMIADDWDSMDGWVDAIRLVYTIHVRGKAECLAGVLAG